ncbi:MAG: phage major capsid protein [Acidobacteriota bacterium]|nr:phage major capsid protein [Acidobacteriota bacterium]
MNIKQLKQKREAAHARATGVATAAGDNLMTAEQRAEFDAAVAERNGLDAQIRDFEALQESDRTSSATAPGFSASVGKDRAENKPWETFGEQLIAVADFAISRGNTKDPRLFAALGQNETVDTDGGFLVQTEFSGELLKRTFDEGIVTRRCRTIPMASSRLVINGIDDANRVGGPAGAGLVVYRAAEAALFTPSKLKFRRVEFNVNKMIGMFYATDELLEDAGALQSQVSEYFPLAFAWNFDNEAINGTGRGQFLGINSSGAIVITPKTAGQATGTFSTQNALDMKSRMYARSWMNSVWFVGPDLENLLYTLTIPGPQGTNVALYTPPGVNGNTSPYGLMLGRPVIVIEQTAALGVQGDIILADMSQYVIAERSGTKFASSIHVAFLTDEQAFRWTVRNDGKPLWDKPVTQNNSANKVSPFVVLQSRP